MYVEQELYAKTGAILKTLFMQKIVRVVGSFWTLGLGSFRVIGLFDSQMQASTVIFYTSIINIPNIFNVQLEPSDDIILVSNSSLGFFFHCTKY